MNKNAYLEPFNFDPDVPIPGTPTDSELLQENHYYQFGMGMPNRTFNSPDYRYGFNGKEKDESGEFGNLTHYDYGFRIYNPGIGKFLSVDPLTKEYPFYTPYQFAGNTPIEAIDLDGAEPLKSIVLDDDGSTVLATVQDDWVIVQAELPSELAQAKGVLSTEDYFKFKEIRKSRNNPLHRAALSALQKGRDVSIAGGLSMNLAEAEGQFTKRVKNGTAGLLAFGFTPMISAAGGAAGLSNTIRGGLGLINFSNVFSANGISFTGDALAQTTFNVIEGKDPIGNFNIIGSFSNTVFKNPYLGNYIGSQFSLTGEGGFQTKSFDGAIVSGTVGGGLGQLSGKASGYLSQNFRLDISSLKLNDLDAITNPIATGVGVGLGTVSNLFGGIGQKTTEDSKKTENPNE